MRGVPRGGGTLLVFSSREKGVSRRKANMAASGTGSERAKVANVAEGNPPRARVPV
jgi:hypothetical protein